MTPAHDSRERLLDLLALEAVEGLDREAQSELALALAKHADDDLPDLAAAAAACAVAFDAADETARDPLPADVAARVTLEARGFFAGRRPPTPPPSPTKQKEEPTTEVHWISRWVMPIGWAAAAALLVVVLTQRDEAAPEREGASRAALMAQADSARARFQPAGPAGYEGVEGDAVWNATAQRGYLRFKGLRPNDPQKAQYQLWIVDPGRDAEPVDGGVFDVPAGQDEVIVPIDAKLAVTDPKAFVITLEQPGGVVVSEGPHLLIAAVD